MERLRYSVILIIVVAFAGGIWTRYLSIPSIQATSLVGIRPNFDSELQLTGTFAEPLADLTGFEVSYPSCARPLAILPVPVTYTAITPTEYRYGRGEYDISYVFNGNVYPEAWISYKFLQNSIALGPAGGKAIRILSKNMDPVGLPWHFNSRSILPRTELQR